MPIPFEFVIGGPAVSQQASPRSRERWKQEVQDTAKRYWGAGPPYAGEVMVAITYFFDGAPPDVDNIPKLILDALIGLVYDDDSQVTDLLCRKRNMNGDLRIQNPSPVLLTTLSGSKQFLHIVVANALSQEVALW